MKTYCFHGEDYKDTYPHVCDSQSRSCSGTRRCRYCVSTRITRPGPLGDPADGVLRRRCAEPGAFARGRSLSVEGVCFLFASFTYSLFLNPRKCRVIRCSSVAIVAGSGLGDDVAVLCDSVTLRVGVNVSYSGIRASGWLTCPRAHSQ